jgi:rSAM/selenodomain-associated transferase 1
MPDKADPTVLPATSDTALIIVARYPQRGAIKTRLASAIGEDATIELYRAFLTDLALKFAAARSQRNQYDLHWCYTPSGIDFGMLLSTLTPTLSASMRCFPQQGEGLGERLHHAFCTAHRLGYRKTIVISSDSPQIRPAIIAQARAALDHADVVLGPAEDGGYYLIAMREPHDVFTGIPMSTSVVLQMTIELACQQNLSVSMLEPLFDIDELPDLLRLTDLLQADHTLAPITAAHLATIKELVIV